MKYATYIKKYGASIMALAMLSACAPSTVADAAKEAESVTSGITSEPADASPDGEGSSDPPKILHLVSNVDGMLGKPGIASDTGYYDVSINADGSSNITYTDFETCNKIYLTSDLGAKQNTDADSSWVSGGIGYLFYNQDMLYIVGQPQLFGDDPQPATLWHCNPDGSNRTKFVEIPANQTMMCGVAADEEGNLYTLLETTTSNGETKNVLTEISIDNGAMSSITEIPMGDGMLGVWQDCFIMTHVKDPDQGASMCELYTLSVADGSKQIIEEYELDSREMAVADGSILYLDNAANCLNRLSLETHETKTLANNLPLQAERGANHVRGLWGDYFVIRISRIENGAEKQTLYGWNISDGTMVTNSYTYQQDGSSHSPELLAAVNGMYLLNYNRIPVTLHTTSADGTVYTMEDYAFPSAIIAESDFWADREDFIEVKDQTLS